MIRRATAEDLPKIRAWLEAEEARDTPGFLCNWNWIEEGQRAGKARVYVLPGGEPVAFLVEDRGSPLLLQVREEYQRQHIGEQLVSDCVARAKRRKQLLLWIECAPQESQRFWHSQGFSPYWDTRDRKVRGYLTIDKRLRLPKGGVPAAVSVRFYPERRKWQPDTPACLEAHPKAVRTADGQVHLAQRVLFHESAHGVEGETVVQIEVDGSLRPPTKARHPEAERMGIKATLHGWYVDGLRLDLEPES